MSFDNLISTCNQSQRNAVLHDSEKSGPVFILAGAGSGKTFVLTHRIVFLILQEFKPENLFALTFTEAAAAEMAERVQGTLKRLGRQDVSKPVITTFHGLAYRFIRGTVDGVANWTRLGFSAPPAVLGEEQKESIKSSLRKKFPSGHFEETFAECLDGPFAKSLLPPDPGDVASGDGETFSEAVRNILLKENLLTFGDMVALGVKLLKDFREVREWYRKECRHLLVDEYQDTSPDQLEFIRLLTAPAFRLFLVGDDDQAIYGFRGADSRCIQNLFDFFPDLEVIKLEYNYRSTSRILDYANTIFLNKPRHLRKKLLPGKVSEHPMFRENLRVSFKLSRRSLSESLWMAGEIRRLKAAYVLDWSCFAVLYRLNRQAPYYRSAVLKLLGEEAVAGMKFMTVHSAKGLQFPVVFLAGLEYGIFPHKHGGKELSPERLEEEKRLFYVGVTRAESILYLCSCRGKMERGKIRKYRISPFLLGAGSSWQKWRIRLLNTLM